MKLRVKAELSEDRRLSWWHRDFRQVHLIYSERHPESVLPDLNRYGVYLLLILGVVVALLEMLETKN